MSGATQRWSELFDKTWGDLPVVVLDCETTGIEETDAVVEIAAVRFENGRPTKRFCSLVNPGKSIPAEATAVHGIRDEDVAGAPQLAMLAPDLKAVCTGALPAAFQAEFDRGFLHATISGSDCLAFEPSFPWLDVFVMIASPKQDKHVRGKGRLRLVECCKRHQIPLEKAHRADGDAEAAGHLLYKIMGDKRPNLGKLFERMRIAREEQELDFLQFLMRERLKTATAAQLRAALEHIPQAKGAQP